MRIELKVFSVKGTLLAQRTAESFPDAQEELASIQEGIDDLELEEV